MTWLDEHKNVGRKAVLLLLLMAIMGPWIYSSDGVPPPEWCDDRYIMLESGRCVELLSGATVLTFMARAFFGLGIGLVTGALAAAEFFRELLFATMLFLFLLPIISTTLLIRGRDSRRRRLFNLLAWLLAAIPVLAVAASGWSELPWRLWGIGLFVILIVVTLGLELFTLLAGARSL